MSDVEQAIFTSAKTDRAAGYHLVARSAGVHAEDARELAVWCPSHDSFLEEGVEAASYNFHPLPSGAYCVSRTVCAGREYSGRGGARVYTHCLIVQPEALAHFANNPFALLETAIAARAMEILSPIPHRLEPLSLSGGAPAVEQTVLARLHDSPGPHETAVLIQAALDAACLAVGGRMATCELFAGLINCLPPACRTLFSFSTGLKFSLRRPFHLIALSEDPSEQRWLAHQNNVTVLDLSGKQPLPPIPLDGWAQFIEHALAAGQTSFLAAQLAKRRFDLKIEDLSALGLQLLEELETSSLEDLGDISPAKIENNYLQNVEKISSSEQSSDFHSAPESIDKPKEIQQAHAAHHRFEKTQLSGENKVAHLEIEVPSQTLDPDSPEVMEKLELLDDLVYDAISGRSEALEQLQTVWPEIKAEFGDSMLAESREQYLRYALTIWEGCVENDTIRNPTQAIQALDVLCLLFNE